MKKSVFRSNYQHVEELKENVKRAMAEKEIDDAKKALDKAVKEVKTEQIAEIIEEEYVEEKEEKKGKKGSKKVDLDD